MENFTPVSAMIGGALIGLSAAILWLGLGKIAGISGVVGNLLSPRVGDVAWRGAFVLGLVLAPVLYGLAGGSVPTSLPVTSAPMIIAGGLLVGFGARLGGGCTSGHGVCGLARLSPSSLVATAAFMASGAATVFVVRHIFGG